MIPALGFEAFSVLLSPTELYLFASGAPDEDCKESLQEFAADFATIRNLPTYKGHRNAA